MFCVVSEERKYSDQFTKQRSFECDKDESNKALEIMLARNLFFSSIENIQIKIYK